MGSANIVFGYAGNGGGMSPQGGTLFFQEGDGENLATNELSSSASSGAASTSRSRNPFAKAVRITLSETGWVKIGPGTPVADKTTSIKMAANTPEYFGIQAGDKVAVIDDA